MSNRSYLVCYDHREIYADDDHVDDYLAEAVYCVPVLWLCLFRPINLVTRTLETDHGAATETAPIANKRDALAHLPAAIERLKSVVTLHGDWMPYQACLTSALTRAPGRNVTIYMNEIAALSGEAFYTGMLRALLFLEGKAIPGGDTAILSMGEFHLGRDLHCPRGFFDRTDLGPEDHANFTSIIGEPFEKDPMPWG